MLKQWREEESCNLQLYNLKKDPREEDNLLEKSPRRKTVAAMRGRLMEHFRTMTPADWPSTQILAESDPATYGGVLATGWCQARV